MSMKKNIKIGVLLMILGLTGTACDDFFDINTDPNNAPVSTVELTLPAGLASISYVMSNQFQILGSFWAQHWTQGPAANQYSAIDDYNINEASFNGAYIELYSGALNDLNYVSKTAEASGDWNYFLIAELSKAYTYQLLVDMYDKVPYFDALQGNVNLTPKFDEGQAIYDDLIVKIDNALSKDRTLSSVRAVGEEDLIFGGDMDQWVKFANTLKLKIYLRQVESREAVAEAGIQALLTSGAEFLDSEDAEMTAFVDVQNFRNPFYETQIATTGRGYVDVVVSNTLLLYLKDELDGTDTFDDPRIPALFNTPASGGSEYIGLLQGDYNTTAFGGADEMSQPDIGPTHPAVLMSVAESKFLQAEAVERLDGDGKNLYEEGIEASFDKLGVTGASALYAPGAEYEYTPGDEEAAIEQIITQKWVAMANFQGLEAHLDHRRTGYPNFFTFPENNVTGDVFPKRLPYPSTELNNNRNQLNAAGGQKQVVSRVWWNEL